MLNKPRKKPFSSGGYVYPPDAFNVTDGPFRPTPSFPAVGGLQEIVFRLENQGRYRSALDEVFNVLDLDPNNEHALRLAITVVGDNRSNQLRAQEPLTAAYLNDRRLDSIFTACSQCKTTEWVSVYCLHEGLLGLNYTTSEILPGYQCYDCGYVACRKCLDGASQNEDRLHALRIYRCPNCGGPNLKAAYPTGRLPRQMARHPEPVVQVVVFREGPIPPDEAYMAGLLERTSPDALEDGAELIGIPVSPWPNDIEKMAQSLLFRLRGERRLKALPEHAEYRLVQDAVGTRVYVAKLMMAPGVQALLKRHLARLVSGHGDDPRLAITIPLWRSLLRSDVLTYTQATTLDSMRESLSDGDHHWQSRRLHNMILIISTIPTSDVERARSFFRGRYMAFLDGEVHALGSHPGEVDIAHWIFCLDGVRQMVHLTFLPENVRAIPTVAIDLLTLRERIELGLA